MKVTIHVTDDDHNITIARRIDRDATDDERTFAFAEAVDEARVAAGIEATGGRVVVVGLDANTLAVPREAVERLRNHDVYAVEMTPSMASNRRRDAIDAFLAAVKAANPEAGL